MYRRNLEMEKAQQYQEQDCTFLSRVTKFPVVRSAMDRTLDIYQKAKEYNGLVGIALQSAEKTALIASERAKPVIAKFETQIEFVDVLACKTLDKLEQSMPLLKKTPEEIVADSMKVYEDTIRKPTLDRINGVKEYGMGKVNALKDYGFQTATTLASTKYGQVVAVAVDDLLLKADTYVDDYLLGIFEEGQCENVKLDPAAGTLEKATVLSQKLQQRIVCHGQIQLKSAKARADEILANLNAVAIAINNLNLKDTPKAFYEHASAAQARILNMLQEIEKNVEAGEKLSMNQKLFLVAKQLIVQLHKIYQKVSFTLKLMPSRFQPRIKKLKTFIIDVYGQLAKAKSFDEVSNVVLFQMQDGVRKLHIIYSEVYDYIFTHRVISWKIGPKEYLPKTKETFDYAIYTQGRADVYKNRAPWMDGPIQLTVYHVGVKGGMHDADVVMAEAGSGHVDMEGVEEAEAGSGHVDMEGVEEAEAGSGHVDMEGVEEAEAGSGHDANKKQIEITKLQWTTFQMKK